MEEERKLNDENGKIVENVPEEELEDLYMPVDNEKDFTSADAEFFKDHGQFASFLQNMDLPEEKKNKKNTNQIKPDEKKKKKANDSVAHLEDYEKRPRALPESWIEQNKSESAVSRRLPVKQRDGTVIAGAVKKVLDKRDEVLEEEEECEEEPLKQQQQQQETIPKQQQQQQQQQSHQENADSDEDSDDEQAKAILRTRFLRQLKLRVAEVCCAIVESPDNAVRSRGGRPSKLQELHQLAAIKDETAKCLVVLSQLRVFVDILPGYYIRRLTDAEKRTIVSKDVRHTRSSENALLVAYQLYLRRLSKMIRTESSAEYRRVAAKCLATLLLERPQFNFWDSIIATLVPVADESNEIARLTCDMFETMLKSDLSGLSTLEFLKNVTKRLKQRNCELSLDLLSTLRHCKVNAALTKQKRARLKKKRKRMRHDEIAQALAEAEATEQKQEVVIRRADALRDLVLIYFRILRSKKKGTCCVLSFNLSSSCKLYTHTHNVGMTRKIILPEAMGGLRRVSHFLNFDVARELLQLLSELVNDEERMPLNCTMELVLTAMRTAAGPGSEMRFDMNPFVEALRKSLRWLHLPRHCEGSESCIETALYSVSNAFLKRREADKRRVTLCAIELLSGSLQMPPNASLASLATCRDLIQRYGSTLKTSLLAPPEMAREELGVMTHANDALLLGTNKNQVTNEEERFTRGSETAWELALLGSHYHPYVAKFAQETALGALPHPSRTAPIMLKRYDTSSGGFNPPVSGKPPVIHKKRKKEDENVVGDVKLASAEKEVRRMESPPDFSPMMKMIKE